MNLLRMIGFFFLAVVSAGAAQFTAPELQLQATVNAALDAFYSESSALLSADQKQAKVLQVIESNYDMTILIRRAIGRNWGQMSPLEQGRTVDLIKQLVMKTYVDGFNGANRPEVRFAKTVQLSDKRIEVASVVHLEGQTLHVVYRLGRTRSGWQMYDIVAEGISIVANYRQQFDDHFRRGTAAELIQKLEELLKEGTLHETITI
ncbi:MAG: MlaC/ttg2D family ABC transporter substrate-binding protein [Opitutales bacterium]